MTFFSNTASAHANCTSIVHHPMGDISGIREVFDDVSRLAVCAFPMAMIKEMIMAKAAVPACYILADRARIYIGETGNVGRRLSDHVADPSKGFAREVFVVMGLEPRWLDKTGAIFLQHRLTEAAEAAGLVEVIKGTNPQVLELPSYRRASYNRFVGDSERLLYDAGCRALRSNFGSQCGDQSSFEDDASIELDECEPMQIGVIATPPVGSELELAYSDLWARGFPAGGGFVVMAGSEVRSLINASATPIVHSRRAELAAADALVDIPGVHGRKRLRVAVWFPSAAIAAKLVTGAHVDSSKWVPTRYPQPIIIAA
jgi:hypothetical protein